MEEPGAGIPVPNPDLSRTLTHSRAFHRRDAQQPVFEGFAETQLLLSQNPLLLGLIKPWNYFRGHRKL